MSDGENILQTVKAAIQDVVAPDVRELKVEVRALREQVSTLERHIQDHFEATNARSDAQFKAILAALGQNKAEAELMVYKQVSALAERVTVLEAKQHLAEQRAA